MNKKLTAAVYINAAAGMLLAFYFFLAPAFILIRDLSDPGLRNGGIPKFAYRLHRALSEKYGTWARQRVSSGKALGLDSHTVSGTEWPIYSSVFYLWATEALQEDWMRNSGLAGDEPAVEARGAIEAAAALISDPNQARWVREYWGDDYLKSKNMFYRMLLINGLTSYQRLTGDKKYQTLLSNQVEAMSAEMDRSPHGLLDDYPGECYPVDILPVITGILRADRVLGTDHSAFVTRALRGFQGTALDPQTGLPSYFADSQTGQGLGPARGAGISSMLNWAPELWPEVAHTWYAAYEKQFWQKGWGMAGFREYPAGLSSHEWLMDVDAGPVIAGYGTAASAFGIGAARANGRFDQAYPLSAEALVAAWPLPDGTLLGARLLSNASDAPFVGEAALLFSLTRRPIGILNSVRGGWPPLTALLGIAFYMLIGILLIATDAKKVKQCMINATREAPSSGMDWQFWIWIGLIATAAAATIFFKPLVGLLVLLVARFFPRPSYGPRPSPA